MALAANHAGITRVPFTAPHYVLAECTGQGGPQPLTDMLETVLATALEDGTAADAVIAQSERERLDFLHLREAVPEEELRLGGAIKHDVAVPIGRIAATVDAVEAFIAAQHPDCTPNILGHIGDGNLHINLRPPAGQTVAALSTRKAGITATIEAIAMAQGGSFSAEHGIGQMRLEGMAAHKSAVELGLMRAVKIALDPHGLFNPGKMLPGKEESSFL
jgi:FAD/FMN-containing dehydrogenase